MNPLFFRCGDPDPPEVRALACAVREDASLFYNAHQIRTTADGLARLTHQGSVLYAPSWYCAELRELVWEEVLVGMVGSICFHESSTSFMLNRGDSTALMGFARVPTSSLENDHEALITPGALVCPRFEHLLRRFEAALRAERLGIESEGFLACLSRLCGDRLARSLRDDLVAVQCLASELPKLRPFARWISLENGLSVYMATALPWLAFSERVPGADLFA